MAKVPIMQIWDDATQQYVAIPSIQGAKGDTGATGATGPQGPKGDTGPAGSDGYTPVKGTDYFTEADKAELVNAVLAALPAAEEVSY